MPLPPVAALKMSDPCGARWKGVVWSPWIALAEATAAFGSIPRKQGIYRIRRPRGKGLLYIGISGSLVSRLHRLERAIHRTDQLGHYAAGCIFRAVGSRAEVSWVVRDPLERRDLLGEEVDLIAAYRTALGESPSCQFAGDRLGG